MQALIWDVDGTLAETERDGHRVAFNLAFEALSLPWRWDAAHYGRLLAVMGGFERLLHDMAQREVVPADREALARELHRRKNIFYAERVHAGAVLLRPGVQALIADCLQAGVRLAVATTTSRGNVDALLSAHRLDGFECLLCAEDAPRKKPDPQVYQRALERLQLPAEQALAIEDSPAGAAAARAAGVPVIVCPSLYFASASFGPVLACGPSLDSTGGWLPTAPPATRVSLDQLRAWHAAGGTVSGDNRGLSAHPGLQASS